MTEVLVNGKKIKTNCNIMDINKVSDYECYGQGDEGKIYKINDNLAFKRFFIQDNNLEKIRKIELLVALKNPYFTFPLGLIRLDGKIIGYYMPFIKEHFGYPSFAYLRHIKSRNTLINLGIKGYEALKYAHDHNITLGDIKYANILIDENNNPVFIDTDNYAYGKFGYDLDPNLSHTLERIYNRNFSQKDNDIYLYSKMIMSYLFSNEVIYIYDNKEFLKKLMSYVEAPKDIKEGLECIFSDSENKPYMGPILKKLNPSITLIPSYYKNKLNIW